MKHIWIVDDKSGTAIFYHNFFGEKDLNPDLVSGLLSALHNFSEVELHSHGIESINMGGLTWVYLWEKDYNILFISCDEKNTDTNTLRVRLKIIKNLFLKEFNITSPEEWQKLWNGDVSKFKSFSKTVEDLIYQWKLAEQMVSKADIFDLIGVFQQILNLYVNIIKMNFFNQKFSEVMREIGNELNKLLETEEYAKDPELRKITLNEDAGWDVLSVNLDKVNPLLLQKILLVLTGKIKNIISEKLGHMLTLNYMSKEIFPYILNNWELLMRLKLEKKLLQIFLTKD
ncbi:MAG: hypothetical protein ACTSU2_01750 [Promethearchaeota archaeon]